MQLDRTRITIRERGIFEIYDLALRVIHGHAGAILGYWLIGAGVFTLLNTWLLAGRWSPPTEGTLQGDYYWQLCLLLIWELPLATAPLTLYLGKTLFLEHPTPGQVMRSLADRAAQLFVIHILMRGLFYFCSVWAYVARADEGAVIFFGFFAVLVTAACYFFWPYANEVLLLEANPLRRKKGRTSTIARILSLHGYASGEVIARSFFALIVGSMLLVSFCVALEQLYVKAMLAAEVDTWLQMVCVQLAFWLTAGFFTVVRFLSYLDIRIRIEGWEIELLLKAEGERIARQLA
ncbi:MAG: hypothetical protein JNM18_13345 [Planctomycetaceae bacterium]|nr:hypothetical protein [Planctomycetaceae bacterium]